MMQEFSVPCTSLDELTPSLFIKLLEEKYPPRPIRRVIPIIFEALVNAWVKNYEQYRFDEHDRQAVINNMKSAAESLVRACNPPAIDGDLLIDCLLALKVIVLLKSNATSPAASAQSVHK